MIRAILRIRLLCLCSDEIFCGRMVLYRFLSLRKCSIMITAYDPFINMWFLAFVVFLPALIAGPILIIRRKKPNKKDTVLGIVSSVALIVLEVLVLSRSILHTEYKFDNPVVAEKSNEELKFSAMELDPADFESFLKDEAGFDSVRVNYDDKFYETLSKGDFVDFAAFEDESRVEGSFYYTEDSLVIVYSVDEGLNEQKVEVPVKN